MTPDESTIAKLFEPELSRIRAEFGDHIALDVVSMLAEQMAEQVKQYEAEGRYMWQRFGKNPSYTVGVDFAAITRDLRTQRHHQAALQIAELRLMAQLN